MTRRKRHPNKTVEDAICFADSKGWRYQKVGNSAHAWGRLLCPLESREGCAMSVWSTPRSAEVHANQIMKRIRQCPHKAKKVAL